MIQHGPSGLNLTLFRQYSASSGRWLSRDPLGGINLYSYCFNDPVGSIDSDGLKVLKLKGLGLTQGYYLYLTAGNGRKCVDRSERTAK